MQSVPINLMSPVKPSDYILSQKTAPKPSSVIHWFNELHDLSQSLYKSIPEVYVSLFTYSNLQIASRRHEHSLLTVTYPKYLSDVFLKGVRVNTFFSYILDPDGPADPDSPPYPADYVQVKKLFSALKDYDPTFVLPEDYNTFYMPFSSASLCLVEGLDEKSMYSLLPYFVPLLKQNQPQLIEYLGYAIDYLNAHKL